MASKGWDMDTKGCKLAGEVWEVAVEGQNVALDRYDVFNKKRKHYVAGPEFATR